MTELLFSERGKLHTAFSERQGLMQSEVNKYRVDYLLNVSEADLVEYLLSKYALEPLVILESEIHQREPKDVVIHTQHQYRDPISIEGTAFPIVVPFCGDAMLFHYQPSHFTTNPPRGEVYTTEIVLTFEVHQSNEHELQNGVKRQIDGLRKYIEWVNLDVKRYNESLRSAISRAIAQRKEKLLADRKLSQALGIPIVRRDDAPKTYVVPEIKRKPKIARPTVVTNVPEPELDYEEYKHILDIIRNMTQVMEQSPRAFIKMGEEDLRTHFLVQLNGQYEGKATGETFNYQGKTDILIREQGKNIFIAECKFWKGPKGLTDTIDQLLGYLSWRDTKTAILLFNRNRNFTSVLGKIPRAVEEHLCYKRTENPAGETEFRYVFHQPGDPNREIILTILAFDIPRIDETEEIL